MSMDVSRLAIEVTSTGIKEASDSLGGLSRSAGSAEKKVTSLTDKLGLLSQAGSSVNGMVGGLSGTMALINSAMQSAAANAAAMAQALGSVTQGMNSLTGAAQNASAAMKKQNEWAGTGVTTLKAMATAAAAYMGFNFVKHSIEAADAWNVMGAKLAIVTGSVNNGKVALQDLFDISQKLRIEMDDSAHLFTRMGPIMRTMGASYKETKDVVEGLGLALKLNGATAMQTKSVMLQFAEAMAKGKLDGAHFNAVAQNGALVMKALEESTKKSYSELAAMKSKGLITPALLLEAIETALPKWREQFASMPITVEDAGTRIKNAWMKAMGELSSETGLNAGLVKAIKVVEDMIPLIRDGLVSAFTAAALWIDRNKEGIAAVWDQTKGLLGDVWHIVTAVASLGGAFSDSTDGVNILAFGIFLVRGAIAVVLDIVKVVAAAFVLAGADVADFFLAPIYLVVKAIELVSDGFSTVLDLIAKGAAATGMKDVAKSLEGVSGLFKKQADGVADLAKNIAHTTDGAREMANGWVSGKSELDKLLDSSKELNLEVNKTPKFDNAAWAKGKGNTAKFDPKAEKEHEKAVKSATDQLNKMVDAYKELDAQAKNIDQFGLSWDKLSKGEKDVIVLTDLLSRTHDKDAKSILNAAIAYAQASADLDRLNQSKISALKAEEAYSKNQSSQFDAAQKELDTINAKIAGYGKVKGSADDAALSEAKLVMIQQGDSMTDDQIKKQQALIDKLEEVQVAKTKLNQMELGDKLTKELDALKPADFSSGFGDAFGSIGKAIDKAGKSIDGFNKKMETLAKMRKEATKLSPEQQQIVLAGIQTEELKNQVNMYGDLAGAAKDFFKQGTTGYKVLEAAERGFRMVELMLSLKNYMQKMGLLTGYTSATVAAQSQQTISTVAGAATEVAAKQGVATANAVAAVANQGNGDPYSAFFRIAAMAAIMAGLGLAVGGGGGGGGSTVTADQIKSTNQAANGTGTVLGDSTAKSDSIANSLARMANNSNIGLTYTSEMLASLRNIDLKMGGMTAQVARIPGLTTGANFNANIGTKTSGITGLFGSTTSREIADTGLKVDGKLSDLVNGGAMQQYLDVLTTKHSSGFLGLGSSTKTSTSREYQGVDAQLANTVGGIFSSISDTILKAGASLGVSAEDMKSRLEQFSISAEVSLKDLHGDDLQKAIQAFFSSSSDQMAAWAAGQFQAFQKAGEGYFETLTRVAAQTEGAKNALAGLGVSMVGLFDVTNKTADLDVELVRQSLMRQESGTSLANILSLLNGTMDDLINGYKQLTAVRNTMQAMGVDGNNLSLDLIRGAGGITGLSDSMGNFTSKFYTSQEQAALKMSQVTMEFNRLGLAMPNSRNEFRNLVTALMQGGSAGQEMAGRILSLSGDFSDAMDAMDSKLTDARTSLTDAYNRESQALQTTRDKMQGFADSLKTFKESLTMSDMSPLSTMEKYQNALAKYDSVSTAAQGGDETAISQFQAAANDLLTYSKQVNASGTNYLNDFNRVLAATDALQQYTQGQATSAQTQLDVMKQQVDALLNINTSVMTVAQAISDLMVLMGGAPSTAVATAVAASATTTSDPTAQTAPTALTTPDNAQTAAALQAATTAQANSNLIAEVQGLRSEVAGMRQDVRDQTGTLAGATYDANAQAAQTIVAGYKSVQMTVQYARPIDIA